ncbi:MAG: hypothetical protein V4718_18765, partial [Pseudomonadota bacterium]
MALALVLVALVPSVSFASACTAMWGLIGTPLTPTAYQLGYFNTTSNTWVTQTTALTGCGANCNALAGRNDASGLLYFVDRTSRGLFTYNPNTGVQSASLGTIPVPPAPAAAGNILGASFDNNDRLIVYATEGGANPIRYVAMAEINPANGALIGAWTQVRTTAGATPTLAGSGDMNVGNDNVGYMISNTNPPTYHQVNLTAGASFADTNSPPLTITGANGVQIGGVAVNPATQLAQPNLVYFSSGTTNSTTYSLDRTTGVATRLFGTTGFVIADMGNCPIPPDTPTVTKTFSPTFEAGGIGNTTTTLTLTFGNTNTAPVWLLSNFSDVFPAGMVVGPIPSLTTTCTGVPSPTVTVASTSMTWAAGGRIPAGGCSVSFAVSATASITPYVNTIPAGSLSTTAGSNTAPSQATLTVGTDFAVAKQVRAGTTDPLTNTATLGLSQTMQYVLTITNSASGGTGSATFTDTIPTLITPVLTVTAVQVGGGSCSTATAVVGGRTRITGTLTNVLAGSTCTVTVTALANTNTVGTFANTVTIGALAGTVDVDATDNNATATVTL